MDRTFVDSDFGNETPEQAQRHRDQLQADAEARAAKAAADAQAREMAEATERRASLEATLRERFLSAGGTAEEFDSAKAGLIADHLRAETLAGDSEARRLNAARYAN